METMTSVIGYEKTPSGAHKITFLGNRVAGTFDDAIGALAETLAVEGSNPVQVALEQKDGKLFVKGMREIVPPAELGGSETDAEPVGEVTKTAQEIAGDEATSPGADSLAPPPATIEEAAMAMIEGDLTLKHASLEQLITELAFRAGIQVAA